MSVIIYSSPPVTATGSTPSPGPDLVDAANAPADMLCHLAQGKHCTFLNPLDIAAGFSKPRQNPTVGARDVPTYTLVSTTFDQAMDPNSITSGTFYLTGAAGRLIGAVDYIAEGKMAVFQPEEPLSTNQTYTATITADVRQQSGEALAQPLVWTFTTGSGRSPLSGQLANADLSGAAGSMNIYFGDLHGHTGYSDGQGFPSDAYGLARASGLHFFGLTEHAFLVEGGEWPDVLTQANTSTIDGQFVALPGFEYTHAKGHINVFGSDSYIHRDDPAYSDLDDFYAWLLAHPTAIGQFNHPSDPFDFNFYDFAYNAAVDHKIVLQELTTADQFFLSINSGWHLGTLKNRDTHIANWGCCPLMGVIAPALTKDAILEAFAAKRTFFVSPDDSNLAVVMQANGYWMGSAVPNPGTLNFAISAYDPNPSGQPLRMFLYDNGIRVAGTTLPSSTVFSWNPAIAGQLGHYYYVEAYYDGWFYPAYSSPIWVEQLPVAKAGASQFVAPNAIVTLDGHQSWDPDGDPLAYRWTQESGPDTLLSQALSARSTFTAPAATGDLQYRLTVTDTGSLGAFDITSVTVTNQAILSISKGGPTTTELGEPITYTLTVTNHGITDAVDVVITDAIPSSATHLSGGTLLPGNIVSWTIPALSASGGEIQVSLVVMALGGITNDDYRASCLDCISAEGAIAVVTNASHFYLPIITKNR